MGEPKCARIACLRLSPRVDTRNELNSWLAANGPGDGALWGTQGQGGESLRGLFREPSCSTSALQLTEFPVGPPRG